MYNTVVRHLYLKQIDCHSKSSNHLGPYKVITMLLTKVPMYITFPRLVYVITGKFPLNPLHLSHPAPHPSPAIITLNLSETGNSRKLTGHAHP